MKLWRIWHALSRPTSFQSSEICPVAFPPIVPLLTVAVLLPTSRSFPGNFPDRSFLVFPTSHLGLPSQSPKVHEAHSRQLIRSPLRWSHFDPAASVGRMSEGSRGSDVCPAHRKSVEPSDVRSTAGFPTAPFSRSRRFVGLFTIRCHNAWTDASRLLEVT
jgi:hypothetical protein